MTRANTQKCYNLIRYFTEVLRLLNCIKFTGAVSLEVVLGYNCCAAVNLPQVVYISRKFTFAVSRANDNIVFVPRDD